MVDGYTSYLLAVKHGESFVMYDLCRGMVIHAAHKPGGKLYTWELPGNLAGKVRVGDKVVVETERGTRTVIVAGVQEYGRQEHEATRMVIRRCKKGVSHG